MAKVKLQSVSASSRWLQCTKSLEHNKTFTQNIYATKGNLIHLVASLRLREIFHKENHSDEIDRLMKEDYVNEQDKTIVAKWDNDCQSTYERYINYAIMMYKKYEPHTIEIEKKTWITWYGHKKYGFIDLIMISDDYTIIIDLKTGRGKVESEENSQMLMYAIGKIQEQAQQKDKFVGKYILSICQTLINNVEEVEYSLSWISRWYNSHILKMREINTGELQFDPSPTACKWCDYRDSCNARIKKGVV